MTPEPGRELPAGLRRALGPRWDFASDGRHLDIRHRDRGSPYRPPRRTPDWTELLNRLEAAFTDHGVGRARPLPLRWGRETELTISAVQALDPYVKHRQPFTYRTGYLPQPVVRFTGDRDEAGQLADGFLTSFVNISRVEPIQSVNDHAAILDSWIGVLSRLGLHARHLEFSGSLQVWRRAPVQGITLHYNHAGIPLGDIVLIWNTEDPSYLVTDLGSGFERLRWTIARRCWTELVHGQLSVGVPPGVLDALRTAVLLIACGVRPASRGPGSTVRRLLREMSRNPAGLQLNTIARCAYRYWNLTAPVRLPWPEVVLIMEKEFVLTGRRPVK